MSLEARRRSTLRRLASGVKFRMAARSIRAEQAARREQFESLPRRTGAVVFLGDSISQFGLWDEWFPEVLTVNRGIGGETTRDILARLDSAIADPGAVLILAGTNDLTAGAAVSDIADGLRQIVTGVQHRAPRAKVVIQSVLPRERAHVAELRELNRQIRLIAEAAGAMFIDLWPAFGDESGALRSEYTRDGLHLSGRGYAAWVSVLRRTAGSPLAPSAVETRANPGPPPP